MIGDAFANKLQVTSLHAPTASNGTTYGAGTSGQVLKTNGTSVYWAADSDTDTHRPIQVNGTQILASNNTTALNLKAGTNVSVTNSSGTVTIAATDTTYSAGTGLSLSSTTFNHSNSVTAKTAFVDTATTASANGGTIKVTDIKYDAQGHITATQDRTITLSQTTYTLSGLGGVGTVSASGTAPLTLSASKSGTTASISGSVAAASTTAAGVVQLSSATNSTSETLAATAKAVKAAYDLAASKTSNTGTVTSVSGTDGLTGTVTTTGSLSHAVPTGASASGQATSGLLDVVKGVTTDKFGHTTGVTTSLGKSVPFVTGTSTADGAWLGSLTGLTAYYDGLLILYKPNRAGASTTTLDLNGIGTATVYLNNGTKLGTHYPANQPILLVYSSSQNNGCWMCLDSYDSGNTNTLLRTFASSTNVELPIAGLSAAGNVTTTAPDLTTSYKNLYGGVPSTLANQATINPSTGRITVPGGVTANLTGVASKATAANLTTTANAIAIYTDTAGTFGTKATASGAAYATETNGALTFGTLPVAQGGTGQTSVANIKAGKDGDGNTISSTYLKRAGGTMTGDLTLKGDPTNALHAATKQYVDGIVAANDAMVFKGGLAGAAATTYTPAADCGHTYRVTAAGLINGIQVEVGDILICTTDNTAAATSANVSTVQANWVIIQSNVDAPLYKDGNTFTGGKVLVSDSTAGKVKEGTISVAQHSFTPTVSAVTKPGVNTDSVYGIDTDGELPTFTQGTFSEGTLPSLDTSKFSQGSLPSLSMSVVNEVLSFTWSEGGLPSIASGFFSPGTLPAHAADTFTQGAMPTKVQKTFVTGISTAATVTMNAITLDHSVTIS